MSIAVSQLKQHVQGGTKHELELQTAAWHSGYAVIGRLIFTQLDRVSVQIFPV